MTFTKIYFHKEYEIRQSAKSYRWFVYKDNKMLQGDDGFTTFYFKDIIDDCLKIKNWKPKEGVA